MAGTSGSWLYIAQEDKAFQLCLLFHKIGFEQLIEMQ